jgi:DNA-cytosine methyltransferase
MKNRFAPETALLFFRDFRHFRPTKEIMRIGSLCSGYGGLDMAVLDVFPSAEIAWFCEIDPGASKVLETQFPGIPVFGDITQLDFSALEPVDLLTAGFPCQDVSVAGARKGLSGDTRTGLWFEVARAIAEIRPKMIFLENTDGLLFAKAASSLEYCEGCVGDGSGESLLRALGAVLGSLAELGYDAKWCSVRAADTGAPHRRKRVFIVATPNSRSAGLEGDPREERPDGILAA